MATKGAGKHEVAAAPRIKPITKLDGLSSLAAETQPGGPLKLATGKPFALRLPKSAVPWKPPPWKPSGPVKPTTAKLFIVEAKENFCVEPFQDHQSPQLVHPN